jgi:SAM-dependent methyltransferase
VREDPNEMTSNADSQLAAPHATESAPAVKQASAVSSVALSCPACGRAAGVQPAEQYGRYSLYACASCDLHFWEPRELPDAYWYEQMYGGRDEKLLPLEPGHKYFLADPIAPGQGELLDIGCGTGNFLAAARDAGYEVSGTELDRNAARFAKERVGLPRVFPLTISEFVERYPDQKFEVVTLFEVLEHQAAPVEFVQKVKSCLRPRGFIALSVPNRERWLTGPDVLDYPPNHFLRWNSHALTSLLSTHGFEILSVREQAAGFVHTAQMINLSLRTGLSRSRAGEAPASFRDIMQMEPDQAEAVLHAAPTVRQRAIQMLRRIRYAVCYPAALAVYPYVWMRGYKGTYLYCLARLKD